jgi:aspartate kinase
LIRGVSCSKDEAKVTVSGVPHKPGVAASIFRNLADQALNVDMIIQNIGESTDTDISFTVPKADAGRAVEAIQKIARKIGIKKITKDLNLSKISVVGVGMRSHAGVAAAMFEIMGKHKINIEMISTSEIKISCVVKRDQADKAVQLLHKEFELSTKKK